MTTVLGPDAGPPLQSSTFADRFGAQLRQHRRQRGLGRRHMATGALHGPLLRALERGQVPLDGDILTQAAAAYDIDLADVLAAPPRLRVTSTTVGFDSGDQPVDGDVISAAAAAITARAHETGIPCLMMRRDTVRLAAVTELPIVMAAGRLAERIGLRGASVRAVSALALSDAAAVGVVWWPSRPTQA